MTSSDRSVAADLAPAGPLRSVPDLRIGDLLVRDVLERLLVAGTCEQVAAAPLPLLLDLPGVRAAAVVLREAGRVVVADSSGYDCDAFGAGVALPLDAGLPVTEAVRTGRTVVRGGGPSWVAVPFVRSRAGAGALLLSLDGAPPREQADLVRLERLVRALGEAFDRAAGQDRSPGRTG